MHQTIISLSICLVISFLTSAQNTDKEFYGSSTKVQYQEAKTFCQGGGGRLVLTESQSKFDDVERWININYLSVADPYFWTSTKYTPSGVKLSDGSQGYARWTEGYPVPIRRKPDDTRVLLSKTGSLNGGSAKLAIALCERPKSQNACADRRKTKDCERWKADFCEHRDWAFWMKTNCARTCGHCGQSADQKQPSDCRDESVCVIRSQRECKGFLFKTFCKFSCGFC